MATVLHVDDDLALARLVTRALTAAGYDVHHAATWAEGFAFLHERRPDVVLLDWGLPDVDGLEACRRLRSDPIVGDVPVIMVTGRGLEADLVAGLETGADDYVTKPFSLKELHARVQAVLRRTSLRRGATPPAPPPAARVQRSGLSIDLQARRVKIGGRDVPLRAREFDLLAHLATAPGRVFRRDELLAAVWRFEHTKGLITRTVDVHVRRLRMKLGPAGKQIETVKRVGYRFNAGRNARVS